MARFTKQPRPQRIAAAAFLFALALIGGAAGQSTTITIQGTQNGGTVPWTDTPAPGASITRVQVGMDCILAGVKVTYSDGTNVQHGRLPGSGGSSIDLTVAAGETITMVEWQLTRDGQWIAALRLTKTLVGGGTTTSAAFIPNGCASPPTGTWLSATPSTPGYFLTGISGGLDGSGDNRIVNFVWTQGGPICVVSPFPGAAFTDPTGACGCVSVSGVPTNVPPGSVQNEAYNRCSQCYALRADSFVGSMVPVFPTTGVSNALMRFCLQFVKDLRTTSDAISEMSQIIYGPAGTDADRAKMLKALKCLYELAIAPGVGSTISNAWMCANAYLRGDAYALSQLPAALQAIPA